MKNTTKQTNGAGSKRFHRAVDGRMLGGVAAGLATYFSVQVTYVRIAFAVLSILGGAGFPLYLAAWALIPEEGSEAAIADRLLRHAGGATTS
jgi:phage shock protein PspC (stress-responsive transcriptional regulator)